MAKTVPQGTNKPQQYHPDPRRHVLQRKSNAGHMVSVITIVGNSAPRMQENGPQRRRKNDQ